MDDSPAAGGGASEGGIFGNFPTPDSWKKCDDVTQRNDVTNTVVTMTTFVYTNLVSTSIDDIFYVCT